MTETVGETFRDAAVRVRAAISERARAALLGVSTYQPPDAGNMADLSLDAGLVERLRRMLGGQLAPQSRSRTRWYFADLEAAEHNADGGSLALAAQLMTAARKDGVFAGVLSTRTGGLVRLPRRFRGDDEVKRALELGHDSVRSVFDEMFPPAELGLLAGDGLLIGVGVGELLPVAGRDYPVFTRLDPQYLSYVWSENRWYYTSIIGRLPITPGDGRWILHAPGGRVAPWSVGLWRAIGNAFIRKTHAQLHNDAWQAKLANPARVAVAPAGASEQQSESHFKRVMAWGINTVFGLTPGYDVKLIESNGRGHESFEKTIADQNNEYIISIAGQTVTVDGGAGFQNSDIHKTIRADLIKETADSLAYTINTQGLPVFIALRFGGEQAIFDKPCVYEYDVTPPKDRNSEATSLVTVATAVSTLADALSPHGIALDVAQLCAHFAVPVVEPEAAPEYELDEHGKPKLTVIEGGATDGPGVAAKPTDQAAQDTALNGAQVTSLVMIVQQVAAGLIPRDAAIGIIKRAFLVDDVGAEEMLGSAGNGFVPKTEGDSDAPDAPPTPEPTEPDADADEVAA